MSCPHCKHCQLLRWSPPAGALLMSQVMERYRMGASTVAKAAAAGLLVPMESKGDPEARRRWYVVPDDKTLREWYAATPSGKPTVIRDKENRQLAGLCWLLLFGAEISGAAILRMADDLGASKTGLQRAIDRARAIDASLTESYRTMGRGVVNDPLTLAPGMRIEIAIPGRESPPAIYEIDRRNGAGWQTVKGGRIPDSAPCWSGGWVTFAR